MLLELVFVSLSSLNSPPMPFSPCAVTVCKMKSSPSVRALPPPGLPLMCPTRSFHSFPACLGPRTLLRNALLEKLAWPTSLPLAEHGINPVTLLIEPPFQSFLRKTSESRGGIPVHKSLTALVVWGFTGTAAGLMCLPTVATELHTGS